MLLGVLIVLYVGTQLAASAVTAISADPTQRRIMFALPFVFVDLHHQLPGRPDRLLDHDERLDDRAAAAVKKLYPKPVPATAGAATAATRQARAREAARAAAAADGGNGSDGEPRQGGGQGQGAGRANGGGRRRRRRSLRARRRSARGAGGERRSASPRTCRRGEGDSLGEAKWAAMKELEPRFPGLTAGLRQLRGDEEPTARTVPRACAPRWTRRPGARRPRTIPEEPAERVRAIVGRVVHALGLRATVDIEETRRGDPRDGERRRPRSPDRQARVDDRRAPAPGVPRGLPGRRGSASR